MGDTRDAHPAADADAAAPLLRVRGVSKRFPGVQALDDVRLTLRRGEVHALMGENGAGKSTLIKVLTGVERPDAGVIEIAGETVQPASPRHAEAIGISTVYQEVNLVPMLSVTENLCVGRYPRRRGLISWRAARRRAQVSLDRVGLKIDPGRQLNEYSVAVQQMVAIARALDTQTKLLILDEPTSSLDEDEVDRLFVLMARLRDEGLGILFVTHFLDQVYRICDRITVLRNGQFIGEYLTADLPRLELVARMVGKQVDALQREEQAERAAHAAATTNAPVLVQVEELGRRGSVAPVTFDVPKGQTVGLAGLLGSGRSETARLLFGVDQADTGVLRVDGQTVRPRSPRQAVKLGFAFTPEDRKAAGVIPNLSVRENIILALQSRRGLWRRIKPAQQRALADRFIQALGIKTPSREQLVRNLSGGNQQKVLLARWLAVQPRLFILDEPTRGIDVGAKAEIEKLVGELTAGGMSVIFISSELEEVVRTSDRVVVLRDRRQVGELIGDAIDERAILSMIARKEEPVRA